MESGVMSTRQIPTKALVAGAVSADLIDYSSQESGKKLMANNVIDEEVISQAKKVERMAELITLLNKYRNSYYNESESPVSDFEYDQLYDKLVELEDDTGVVLPNSPTHTVGYKIKSDFARVKHSHKMLSLDKTKKASDIVKFLCNMPAVAMAKMDGLTCSLRYVDHHFVSAETRGDGIEGQDITQNAEVIRNIPKYIPKGGEVVVDGEVIVDLDTFKLMNSALNESEQFRHPRNYASGSILLQDKNVSRDRGLKFIAWKAIKGFEDTDSFTQRLQDMFDCGFEIVPYISCPFTSEDSVNLAVETIKKLAKDLGKYPIDGLVFGFDSVSYGDSLGETSHHLRSQMAFKFYDELHPTKLIDIEWTIGKSGVITPTAVFEPVDIEGTIVQRASLHNISNIKKLGLRNHCTVYVYRANQVIPQIDMCDDDGDSDIEAPTVCPVCGALTKIKNDGISEFIYCSNEKCEGILLARFENYVSKKAADIDGLSEATLKVLIKSGYIKQFKDLYHLSDYANELKKVDGFGEGSVNALLEAIDKSRTMSVDRYITAMGIDGVGASVAKTISKKFKGDYKKFKNAIESGYNFANISGIGAVTNSSIYKWFTIDTLAEGLEDELNIGSVENSATAADGKMSGKKFCITGTFSKKRDELVKLLEAQGGEFVSSVSKKTDILFVGADAGSKLDKAKSLGVRIVPEEEMGEFLS